MGRKVYQARQAPKVRKANKVFQGPQVLRDRLEQQVRQARRAKLARQVHKVHLERMGLLEMQQLSSLRQSVTSQTPAKS